MSGPLSCCEAEGVGLGHPWSECYMKELKGESKRETITEISQTIAGLGLFVKPYLYYSYKSCDLVSLK